MYALTPWVQRLLVANVAMFVVTATSPGLFNDLAFDPRLVFLRPWTLISYMFLHAGLGHLLSNMIGLGESSLDVAEMMIDAGIDVALEAVFEEPWRALGHRRDRGTQGDVRERVVDETREYEKDT